MDAGRQRRHAGGEPEARLPPTARGDQRLAATLSQNQRRRTVQAGYDQLAPRFGEWSARIEGDPWERFLDELVDRLPDGARVLDLGCGDGARIARLADKFELIAVDLSEQQTQLARTRLPEATVLHRDFTELDFDDESFDAVSALYSFVHVPRAHHLDLFARIRRWLRPEGLFLASLSHVGGPDRAYEWLGVKMFFSGWDANTNRRLVREAGFELVLDELVFMREPEPEGEAGFLWILGRKPL